MKIFSYEKPYLLKLNERTFGQVTTLDTCVGGSSPNAYHDRNICVDGYSASGLGGKLCFPGQTPGSQCTNGNAAHPQCQTGSSVY
jgi:hypothetical protein